MPEWSEYWWTSITGPNNLTRSVARSLHENQNVCLAVPDDLPWQSDMRTAVEKHLRQYADTGSLVMDFIDMEEDEAAIEAAGNIGHYLLERYADLQVAAGYRGREAIQKYIISNHVLDHRILWIKGIRGKWAKPWLSFCRNFPVRTMESGRFLLELRQSGPSVDRGPMPWIEYADTINSYDLTLFNSIFLSQAESGYSPLWQQYAATLCANLCSTDAEVSLAVMMGTDFRTEEPDLEKTAEDPFLERRGLEDPDHILNLVRSGRREAVDRLFWQSQLQVLFPLLEFEVRGLITAYYEEIRQGLFASFRNFKNGKAYRIQQFGEYIDDPNDAELGTIHNMTKLCLDEDTARRLFWPKNQESKARLDLLHEIRNKLAHGDRCSFYEIREFLNGYPFAW